MLIHQDILRFLQIIDANFVEENMPLNFRYSCVVPNDVLYVPAGSILLEKSVLADNVFCRVSLPLLTAELIDSVLFSNGVTGKTL